MSKQMDFSDALSNLKSGFRIYREGWNGKGMWLGIKRPSPRSDMSMPYIYMKTAQGNYVPWLASQADILANDWYTGEAIASDVAPGQSTVLAEDQLPKGNVHGA